MVITHSALPPLAPAGTIRGEAGSGLAVTSKPLPEEPSSLPPRPQTEVVVASGDLAESVRVGKFTVENVECAVMPAEAALAGPLLGQTFLKNFAYKIDRAKGKLVMTKLEAPSTKSPTRGSLGLQDSDSGEH